MKKLLLLLLMFGLLSACGHSQNPVVTIKTELGNIEIELFVEQAPITANHFLENIDAQIFEKACFYRVVRPDNQPNNNVKIEVIQGGLFHDSIVDQMPVIVHETTAKTGILHKDGVISMARLKPGSASTEFFICLGDQPELDFGGQRNPDGQGFAAFGKVIRGMNVVRQIQQMKDQNQMLVRRIPILSITRKSADQ